MNLDNIVNTLINYLKRIYEKTAFLIYVYLSKGFVYCDYKILSTKKVENKEAELEKKQLFSKYSFNIFEEYFNSDQIKSEVIEIKIVYLNNPEKIDYKVNNDIDEEIFAAELFNNWIEEYTKLNS